jgi:hypothetical protein
MEKKIIILTHHLDFLHSESKCTLISFLPSCGRSYEHFPVDLPYTCAKEDKELSLKILSNGVSLVMFMSDNNMVA